MGHGEQDVHAGGGGGGLQHQGHSGRRPRDKQVPFPVFDLEDMKHKKGNANDKKYNEQLAKFNTNIKA